MVKTQWTDGYTCYFQKWTLLDSNGYLRILFYFWIKTGNSNSLMLWKNERNFTVPKADEIKLSGLNKDIKLNSSILYFINSNQEIVLSRPSLHREVRPEGHSTERSRGFCVLLEETSTTQMLFQHRPSSRVLIRSSTRISAEILPSCLLLKHAETEELPIW